MILLHDMTERKRAVDALRQLNQDLEARVSARTEALALELAERKQSRAGACRKRKEIPRTLPSQPRRDRPSSL